MNRIALIDKRQNFLADINTRMIMDDERSFTIETVLSDATAICGVIDQYRPTMLVISDNMIEDMPDWDFSVPVVMYASDVTRLQKINEMGLDNFGVITSVQSLLDAIDGNKIYKGTTSALPTQNIPTIPTNNIGPQVTDNILPKEQHITQGMQPNYPYFGQMSENQSMATNNGMMSPYGYGYPYPNMGMPNGGVPMPQGAQPNAMNENVMPSITPSQSMYSNINGVMPPYGYGYPYPNIGMPNGGVPMPQGAQPNAMNNTVNQNPAQSIVQNPEIQAQIAGAVSQAFGNARNERMSQFVDQDAALSSSKTKIISTYSAKGGVGKTTVAKELATYLACISENGKRYKVCIVDFNVDFGDVLTVLDYKTNVKAMIDWIHDIRNRLTRMIKSKGMDVNQLDSDSIDELAEDITYTKDEIYEYLQKDERTGLFALTAPTEHEDTMDIQQRETYVILNAIKDCGEFDFIICDTGNNTRDTTFNALELSDLVLLICTQDTTTANDNDAFLSAAEKIGFDSSKIKIVINAIRPQTQMGISVQEVEKCFEKYECYGRIKYDPVIAKSNNSGAPLVIQKKQAEFTASIAEIAEHILGKKCTTSKAPKKNPFFGLFRK